MSQELYKGSDKVLELTPTSRSYTFLGEEFSETTTFRLVARAKMVKDGVESFKDVEKEVTLTFKEAVVEIIPEVKTGIPGSILLSDRDESLNEEDKLLELTEEIILNSTSISPKNDDEGRYVFSFELTDIIKYKNYAPANPQELENGGVFEYIDMPHLMGLNIYEALNILDGIGLQVEIEGSGNVVLDQFPYEGVRLIKNGIVVVKT